MKYLNTKENYVKALLALFLSTIFWGSAGVVMKLSLDNISPHYLLAFRFGIAALVMLIVFHKQLGHIGKRTFKIGAIMGIILYIEFAFYTYGLQFTTATKSNFIIGAYVILVPFAYLIINRKWPGKSSFFGALICLVGIAFVLLDDFTAINKGDLITMVSSAGYAAHVVVTAKYVKHEDPIQLNIMQITTGAVIALVVAISSGPVPIEFMAKEGASFLYLGIGCTIMPYLLSVYGQQYVKTTTAAIILSFESVVGCVMAILVLNETLTPQLVFGAILIVGSLLITEVDYKKIFQKITTKETV